MITMFLVFACFRGWDKTTHGIKRTLKYVLIISIVLQTPVLYGLAMICLPKEGFVIGDKVVHANDCTNCVVVRL